jgi:hypothetical protein
MLCVHVHKHACLCIPWALSDPVPKNTHSQPRENCGSLTHLSKAFLAITYSNVFEDTLNI